MKSPFLILCFLTLGFSQLLAQEKAYYNQTEMGVMFGNWSENSETRVNFSMITFHGVKFSKHHALGFSLGFDPYQTVDIIPFALGWRGFLGKENAAQLIGGFDIGGGSTILGETVENEWGKTWYEGGVMASPSIGGFFPGKKGKSALTLTLAYKLQNFSLYNGYYQQGNPVPILHSSLPPGYNSLTETSYSLRSLVLRIGLSF